MTDYEKALALDLTILPWLEEWYYSNVSDEHMIAMTVAAIQLHREQELIEALTKEQARIRAENGLPQSASQTAPSEMGPLAKHKTLPHCQRLPP